MQQFFTPQSLSRAGQRLTRTPVIISEIRVGGNPSLVLLRRCDEPLCCALVMCPCDVPEARAGGGISSGGEFFKKSQNNFVSSEKVSTFAVPFDENGIF